MTGSCTCPTCESEGVSTIDFAKLGQVVRQVVPFLDRVIDINYYPTDEAGVSNARWRPVGLGLMGLQDVFFKLDLPFDSPIARDISRRISEEIYFNALWASTELAEANGPHAAFKESRATSSAGPRCASASRSTVFATRS